MTLVPQRAQVDQRSQDRRIAISVPRFRSRPGRAFGRLLGRSPDLTVKLDERTGYCWELIDGRRNVEQICGLMQQRFGRQVEPAVQRTIELLRILERNRLVTFR